MPNAEVVVGLHSEEVAAEAAVGDGVAAKVAAGHRAGAGLPGLRTIQVW